MMIESERRKQRKGLKTTLLVAILLLVSYKIAVAIVGLLTFSIKEHPVGVTIFIAVCVAELLFAIYVMVQRQKRISFYRKTIKTVKKIKKRWALEMERKSGFLYSLSVVLNIAGGVAMVIGAIACCFFIILPIIAVFSLLFLLFILIMNLISLARVSKKKISDIFEKVSDAMFNKLASLI